MILQEGDIRFRFDNIVRWWKPDAITHKGLKAVDFIIEIEDAFLFIEIKDANNPRARKEALVEFLEKMQNDKLVFDLGQKFKDTVLYYWACEQTFDKPVRYLVLLEASFIDAALRTTLIEKVKGYLPFLQEKDDNIVRGIISSFDLLDIHMWNEVIALYPVSRESTETTST